MSGIDDSLRIFLHPAKRAQLTKNFQGQPIPLPKRGLAVGNSYVRTLVTLTERKNRIDNIKKPTVNLS